MPNTEALTQKPDRATPARMLTMALKSDFVSKVTQVYAAQILRAGLGLATSIAVARLLGPSGRGEFAIAAAVGTMGVQFANLGLHTANTYFVARDRTSLPFLTGNTLFVSFGLGCLSAVVLGCVVWLKPGLLSLDSTLLGLALAWIPFGLAYLLMQNLLLGLQEIRNYNVIELANKFLPLLLVAFFWVVGCANVTNVFAAGLVALVICCTWEYAALTKHMDRGPSVSYTFFRSNVIYAIKAYSAALFCFLVLRSDLFLVKYFLGMEQAGYYSIAATMADFSSMIAVVIGTILMPRLSAMSDWDLKLKLTRKVVLGTAIATAPLMFSASILAFPLVRLMFGTAFAPSSTAFVLLAPGIFFLGLHSVSVQLLNSIGYPKSVVGIWGICALLNIGANFWAIPRFGIAGASAVSSACYFLAFLFVLIVIATTARRMQHNGKSATL